MIKTTVDSNVSLSYLNVSQICVTVVKRMNFNQLAVSTERTDDCPSDEHLENLIPVFLSQKFDMKNEDHFKINYLIS